MAVHFNTDVKAPLMKSRPIILVVQQPPIALATMKKGALPMTNMANTATAQTTTTATPKQGAGNFLKGLLKTALGAVTGFFTGGPAGAAIGGGSALLSLLGGKNKAATAATTETAATTSTTTAATTESKVDLAGLLKTGTDIFNFAKELFGKA